MFLITKLKQQHDEGVGFLMNVAVAAQEAMTNCLCAEGSDDGPDECENSTADGYCKVAIDKLKGLLRTEVKPPVRK